MNGEKKRDLEEFFVGAGVGPVGVYTEFVTMLEPGGDLFYRGLLEIGGESGLAYADGVSRQNRSSSIGHPGNRRLKMGDKEEFQRR